MALFKSDASIAFPGSDLSTLERSDSGGQFILTTKFTGFSGSQSPLPGYYLDRMARESAQNEEGLKAFLDLFSHRWTQFVYHAAQIPLLRLFSQRWTMSFHSGCMRWWAQRQSKRARQTRHQSQQNAGLRRDTGNTGRSPDVVSNWSATASIYLMSASKLAVA